MTALGAKEWEEYAKLIGAVTLTWNSCVLQLLRVFTHLTGIESPVADAIVFSMQSDSSQRRMIGRVAEAVGLAEADQLSLKRLLKRLEAVSSGRNLAAHIIFGVTAFDPATGEWGPKVVPALPHRQDHRLADDFAAQFRDVERKLSEIGRDLDRWLVEAPFPPRPWGLPALPRAAEAQLAEAVHRNIHDAENKPT